METKNKLRKKFLKLRKKKYFHVDSNKFTQLISYIKKKFTKKKNIHLALYYPVNCEFNVLSIFDNDKFSEIVTLLPIIKKNKIMHFFEWRKDDILRINKYGILEPIKNNYTVVPDIILVPLLAYDKFKNRLGYGGGYYDKFLNNYIKKNKKVETIGVGFSFQNYHKLPFKEHDIRLNKIFTERGFI